MYKCCVGWELIPEGCFSVYKGQHSGAVDRNLHFFLSYVVLKIVDEFISLTVRGRISQEHLWVIIINIGFIEGAARRELEWRSVLSSL